MSVYLFPETQKDVSSAEHTWFVYILVEFFNKLSPCVSVCRLSSGSDEPASSEILFWLEWVLWEWTSQGLFLPLKVMRLTKILHGYSTENSNQKPTSFKPLSMSIDWWFYLTKIVIFVALPQDPISEESVHTECTESRNHAALSLLW